jgi:histidinol-phosphatase
VGTDVAADLELALALADLADSITLPRFGSLDLAVDTKPDRSPVTEADRAVERAIRERLAEVRPAHGVLGEEYGVDGEGADVRWILDPIDGTRNYLRGVPVWGTLIAVEAGGDVVVGVASAPALGRRWWAARGLGAFADGRRIGVSKVAALADAVVSDAGCDPRLRACWHHRSFGDFWQHMLVAEGVVDVAVDPEVSLWDLAVVQVIVEEAGGRFTDLAGRRRPDGGSGLSTNGLLHDEVLRRLRTPG